MLRVLTVRWGECRVRWGKNTYCKNRKFNYKHSINLLNALSALSIFSSLIRVCATFFYIFNSKQFILLLLYVLFCACKHVRTKFLFDTLIWTFLAYVRVRYVFLLIYRDDKIKFFLLSTSPSNITCRTLKFHYIIT